MFARNDLNLEWLEIAGQARNDGDRGQWQRGNDGRAGGGGSRAPALRWCGVARAA